MRRLFVLVVLSMAALPAGTVFSAVDSRQARSFVGQDLHLKGAEVISYKGRAGETSLFFPQGFDYVFVFAKGFSMAVGANEFSSDKAVVWLESAANGSGAGDYKASVYLEGTVSVKKGRGALASGLRETVIKKGQSLVVRFRVSGEVFVTAERREIADPRGLELYRKGISAVGSVPAGPKFVVQPEALVHELPARPAKKSVAAKPPEKEIVAKVVKKKVSARPKKAGLLELVFKPRKKPEKKKPAKPGLIEEVIARAEAKAAAKPKPKEPLFRYPVNISPAGEGPLKFESAPSPEGVDIAVLTQRFYLWQKQDEKGGLLELQADNAVVYYVREKLSSSQGQGPMQEVIASGAVQAIYMSGDVLLTEGGRTVRADEFYYDFELKKAVAVNAVIRNFDTERGIPIYVRAAKLRQFAENKFAGENITLTSSEFHQPQVSLTASEIIITDTTDVDARQGKISDSSYDAQMRDVRFKLGRRTLFYWPFLRSNLQRPDVPIKSAHIGHDSIWGTTVETQWYLARLLGLREPAGTESTFSADYYSKRGFGTGAEIDYKREKYFGKVLGYMIDDSGEDRLGRSTARRNLEPPRRLRGRLLWRHRHFLPYNWQLTTEVSYLSDRNFLESYYRGQFYTDKGQETLVHLKRIEDNWGLSILSKVRINDFADELEELPTVEYHLTGQSLFDDKFTLYSDTEVGRLRQRLGSPTLLTEPQEFYTFLFERAELDMPMTVGRMKVVPFVAGTVGFEDQLGFRTDLGGGAGGRKDEVWLGEAGARVSGPALWKVYPNVKSRLWDLKQLRHIIKPELTVVSYIPDDSVIEQRDTVNVGISQRLQTKRGRAGEERTVDWMRLNTDITWVSNSGDASAGADRFIWNKPFIPMRTRRSSDTFGPRRDYFGADYAWYISDTFTLLSDMNYDIKSGVVQQFDIGVSHLRWPNLSYYVGSRYLRRTVSEGEKGTNAFTFAATYILDPRYTLVFSQQFDFDYGANIRSDITLIRQYHRVCWAITFSADESLDSHGVMLSVWPQGVSELGIGSKRYMGLGSSAGY